MSVRRGAKMGRSSREKRDEMGKDVWSRGVVRLTPRLRYLNRIFLATTSWISIVPALRPVSSTPAAFQTASAATSNIELLIQLDDKM